MTDDELLIECKKDLGMPLTPSNLDNQVKRKILAVKSYMKGSGVSDEMMEDDLAIGTIIMGVNDLLNNSSSYSNLFNIMITQLAARS